MIAFRAKTLVEENLIPLAMEELDKREVSYNKIKKSEADKVSKKNSKALILRSFKKNKMGYFVVQFQSKEVYNYVKKLITKTFRLRITDVDEKNRIITTITIIITPIITAPPITPIAVAAIHTMQTTTAIQNVTK